jgi:hypothetical protein
MRIFVVRIFIFSILPLLLAAAVIVLDKTASSKERRLEAILILFLALGVAGSGIGNAFAHLFLSDVVARSIGWPIGSPFQLEVAFANLALGVLGLVAVDRRDGFREATVIAVTVFSVGATIVHIIDIAATGNLAPGNTLQNVLNLFRPALLILVLFLARRAQAAPDSETRTPALGLWRTAILQAAGPVTASVATAFGLGFALDRPILITTIGTAIAFAIVLVMLHRSPVHDLRGL